MNATLTSNSTSLAKSVMEKLKDEIINGSLEPGTILSRRKIAGKYGVSYIPVVEALVHLEYTGLIESTPGQMARVAYVNAERIMDFYTMRETYEVTSFRLACEFGTEAQFKELEKLGKKLEKYRKNFNPQKGPELDIQFHAMVAAMSGCKSLIQALDDLGNHHRFHANWTKFHQTPPTEVDPKFPDHLELVEVLRSRDVNLAEDKIRYHIRSAMNAELNSFQPIMQSRIRT